MENTKQLRFCGINRALLASFTANSLYVAYGALTGYVSPAIPNINTHRNPFHVNPEQGSWVSSIVFLGAIIGGLLSGPLCDYFGRKLAMILTSLLAVISMTIVGGSSTVNTMYVGMFVSGIASNANSTVVLIYAAEIAPSHSRGFLICLFNVLWSAGNLLIYVVGAVLPWNWLAIVVAALFVLPLFPLLFCAESPRWFMLKENKEAALFSLKWFRGEHADVDEEIRVVENSLRFASKGLMAYVELLQFDNLKPLSICVFLMGVQQFCGSEILQAFSVTLFQDAGVQIDPYIQTIVIGLLAVLGSIASLSVIDSLGRRNSLLISSTTMAVSMAATGVFFKIHEMNSIFAEQNLYWLPVVSFSISNFAFYFGLNPIVWVYSCEMFATNVRAAAGSIVALAYGVFAFFAVKTYVDIQDAFNNSGMFWLYAGVAALGTLVTLTIVPRDANIILS